MGIFKDPCEYPNEILKESTAGEGLIRALVVLKNKIKEDPS